MKKVILTMLAIGLRGLTVGFIVLLFAASFVAAFMFIPPVHASNPTGYCQKDAGYVIPNYNSAKSYLKFSTILCYDSAYFFIDHANFTNANLGGSSNPTASFGLGWAQGNLTLTGITSTGPTLQDDNSTVGSVSTVSVYYKGTTAPSLSVQQCGSTSALAPNQYTTDKVAWKAATTPAVYLASSTSTSGSIQIRVTHCSPVYLTVSLAAATTGTVQGCSNCVQQTTTPTTTSSTSSQPAYVSTTSNQPNVAGNPLLQGNLGLLLIMSVVVFVFAVAALQRAKPKKRKRPDEGGEGWQEKLKGTLAVSQ